MEPEEEAMHIRNEHARAISRPGYEVFRALEHVGTEGDDLWPAPTIPFQRTPGPLVVGETRERHGIIRAVLSELEPGRKLVWRADLPFLEGTHGFEVTETASGCEVAHVLEADLAWWFVPIWFLKVRSIHDWILERLFDGLEPEPCSA